MIGLPPHGPGMRIGLYGGSFDPPHAGHLHVALWALRRLRLDRVWWMVTPGNPLKDRSGLRPAAERLADTQIMARHPRMVVTDFESRLGTLYTVDTVRTLVERCPGTRFVWIMGADSLAGFARWRGWRELAGLVPIMVVDRPGWTIAAARSRAAFALEAFRRPEADARALMDQAAPAWTFLHGPRSDLSSTALRSRRRSALDPTIVEMTGPLLLSSSGEGDRSLAGRDLP